MTRQHRWTLGKLRKGHPADVRTHLQTARAPRGESAECCPQTQMRRREWEREVTERRHLEEEALLDRRRRDLESAIDATVPKDHDGARRTDQGSV